MSLKGTKQAKKRPAWKTKTLSSVVSGYPNLDRLLCGGIPPYFALALTSPPCDERDSIIKSFLNGGVKNDEITFYVAIDPNLAGYLAAAHPTIFFLFICTPQAEARVSSAPNVFLLKGVDNLTNINIALSLAIRKLDPNQSRSRRICIGIISDVLLQQGPVQTRRWLTELLIQLRSNRFTTLAVVDPQMHPPEQLHAVLGLFDGEINIREAETDQGTARFLKVKRMAGSKFLKDEIRLSENG